MSNVRIELNTAEIAKFLKSDEVVGMLQSHADRIVGNATGSYDTNTHIGRNRANVSISTHDSKTYHRNLKNNELLKMLGGKK